MIILVTEIWCRLRFAFLTFNILSGLLDFRLQDGVLKKVVAAVALNLTATLPSLAKGIYKLSETL